DHYARLVYEGYFFPLGSRASLVKITERKFQAIPGTSIPAAYLRQSMWLVVTQPDLPFVGAPFANDGRELPFQRMRFVTLVTPKIDKPYVVGGTKGSFWVQVGGADFKFHITGTDAAGQPIDLRVPLIFVPLGDLGYLTNIRNAYAITGAQ